MTPDPSKSSIPAGLWAWLAGLAALPLVLPMFARQEAAAAYAVLEIDPPIVTDFALRAGSCLGKPVGQITLAVCAAITSLPAFIWRRNPEVNRLYFIGGVVAVLLTAVLSWSAHNTASKPQRLLDEPGATAPYGR